MFAVLVLCAAARDSRAATVALTATGNNGGQTVHTTVTVNFDTPLFHGTKKKNSSTTVSLGGIIFAAPKTDPVSTIDPTGDPRIRPPARSRSHFGTHSGAPTRTPIHAWRR